MSWIVLEEMCRDPESNTSGASGNNIYLQNLVNFGSKL